MYEFEGHKPLVRRLHFCFIATKGVFLTPPPRFGVKGGGETGDGPPSDETG